MRLTQDTRYQRFPLEIQRMRATQKVENVLRGLLQRYGSQNIKRRLWNHEYAQGRWKCLDTMASDCVYPHVEKHAKNGSILDLGCGPGAVGNELNAGAYHSYTGVDICDMAVEKARSRTSENGRADKNRYFQSDIFSYVPAQQYDVIFFGDSIYYFSNDRISVMLRRYSKHLARDGVFIVRSWLLKDRHRGIIRNIENEFDVVEKQLYNRSELCVIVFRPPASGRASLASADQS
jgi:SAM-dependent methyltransferase